MLARRVGSNPTWDTFDGDGLAFGVKALEKFFYGTSSLSWRRPAAVLAHCYMVNMRRRTSPKYGASPSGGSLFGGEPLAYSFGFESFALGTIR